MHSNKLNLAVMYILSSGAGRFNQIWKRNDDISQKMLSRTLKNIEQNGIVMHSVDGDKMALKMVFSITDFESSLNKILEPLITWSGENVRKVSKHQLNYVNK